MELILYWFHNGNIPGYKGHDTTYIVNCLEHCKNLEDGMIKFMNKIVGVYCLLILTPQYMYALRDRKGIRPLCLARNGNKHAIMSESTALGNYSLIRDIKPGEILRIGNDGVNTIYLAEKLKTAHCCFEYMYFLKPDSFCDGLGVEETRKYMGSVLARDDDFRQGYVVVGVPSIWYRWWERLCTIQ